MLPPSSSEFQSSETPVKAFLTILESSYGSTRDSKRLVLLGIDVYKQYSSSKHEYAIIKVYSTADNIEYFFRAERNVADLPARLPPPTTPADMSSEPRHKFISYSDSSSTPYFQSCKSPVSSRASKGCEARDTIVWVLHPRKDESDVIVASVKFHRPSMVHLYHVAIILDLFHEGNIAYNLIQANCYHFAGVTTSFLAWKYSLTPVSHSPRTEKWNSIRFYDPENEAAINAMDESFDSAVRRFEEQLQRKDAATESARAAMSNNRLLTAENGNLREVLAQKNAEIEGLRKSLEQKRAEVEALRRRTTGDASAGRKDRRTSLPAFMRPRIEHPLLTRPEL